MVLKDLLINGQAADTVIESYKNGRTGYRKGKSGFIECGDTISLNGVSRAAITMPVYFSDTNYSLTYSECVGTGETSDSDTEGGDFNLMLSSKTRNSFVVSVANDNRGISYIARGF